MATSCHHCHSRNIPETASNWQTLLALPNRSGLPRSADELDRNGCSDEHCFDDDTAYELFVKFSGATRMSLIKDNRGSLTQTKWRIVLLAIMAVTSLSGCSLKQWAHNGFMVGPDYCPPVEPVASEWIDYQDPRVISTPTSGADWWTTFNDPTMNDLVQTAHLQNLTLREAGARIMEYRARRNFAAGTLFPQVQEGVGSFMNVRKSANAAFVPPDLSYNALDVGLNANWELDFWGRFRRAIESADAELDASVENYDDVLVLLLAEVASAYTDLRTFQQRLKYAHTNVDSQEQSLSIAEDKLRLGAATERDVQQARTVLEETRSLIPTYEAAARLANNQLCVLLGTPPHDLSMAMGEAPIPLAAPEVAVGIPADLVRRRPDIRRAERELAAQSARIGFATSDLYPHLGLNGSIGLSAQNFNGLFDGSDSVAGSVGPYFRWDLLNYGRLLSRIDIQDAQFEQLVFAYQQQVLVAGREVEDGLITYLRGQERVKNLRASAEAAERALEITKDQYRQGVGDFTAVFIASTVLASQQDQLAAAQGDMTQSLIALYRALGGGWQIRLNGGTRMNTELAINPAPAEFETVLPAEPEEEELDFGTTIPEPGLKVQETLL